MENCIKNNVKLKDVHVVGHSGTYHEIDRRFMFGKTLFLVEHDEFGDESCAIIGGVFHVFVPLFDDVWNGFDDLDETERAEIEARICEIESGGVGV